VENNQRLQTQWSGYIIKIHYTPLLFEVQLPDNQLYEVFYFRTTSGEPEFITDENIRGYATSEGWHVAEPDSLSNPVWRSFPHADKCNICARIREAALLCTVVRAAAVVMSTHGASVLAPYFYLFVHLESGCKPTRDGIASFLATMQRMSGRFQVQRFHAHLPSARSGYRNSLPKDSMGDLCGEGWLLVTGQGGVRTPWPAASDFEVPEAIAARGFGLNNAAMLGFITEAATRHVAHAIKYGSEQQVCDILVTIAPGAPQQALAVLQRLYTEHGAEVLEKVLSSYARDAAEEDAEHLRARIAAAKREAENLQNQHSRQLTGLAASRAKHLQECRTLTEEMQPLRQEITLLRATHSALVKETYDLWTELTVQCKGRGIFIGKYTSESDAIYQQAQHNDNQRGQLQKLLKEERWLRERRDAALDNCNTLKNCI